MSGSGLAYPDGERIAALEVRTQAIREDIADVKSEISSIKNDLTELKKIAQRGGGAFHAIVILGGLVGWLVGILAGIAEMLRTLTGH